MIDGTVHIWSMPGVPWSTMKGVREMLTSVELRKVAMGEN